MMRMTSISACSVDSPLSSNSLTVWGDGEQENALDESQGLPTLLAVINAKGQTRLVEA